MSDAVKKVFRKIRNTHLPQPLPPPSPLEIKIAEWRSDAEKRQMWERDKETKRAASFEKAKLKLEEYRAAQRAEKERQEEIALQRLKNLKKARRVLAKQRSEDE